MRAVTTLGGRAPPSICPKAVAQHFLQLLCGVGQHHSMGALRCAVVWCEGGLWPCAQRVLMQRRCVEAQGWRFTWPARAGAGMNRGSLASGCSHSGLLHGLANLHCSSRHLTKWDMLWLARVRKPSPESMGRAGARHLTEAQLVPAVRAMWENGACSRSIQLTKSDANSTCL